MQQEFIVHDDSRITPFWHRLPKFFLFPLQPQMLLVLIPLAFASLVVPIFPAPRPLDVIIVEGLIWLAAFRHAFRVMERTSQGLLTAADQAGLEASPDRVNLPWKMLAVAILWSFMIGLLAGISETLGWFAYLFVVVAWPACVMALSVTNSLLQCLNPLLWLSIMRTLGKAYLVLFIFLMLLSGGFFALMPLLGPLLRGWLALPLLNLGFLYFNLIMFNMMGYVIYQYHRELGVEVKVGFAEQETRALKRSGRAIKVDPVADEVAAKVAAGDLEGALNAAYEQQRVESDNIAAQERYHKLLLLADKKQRALDHGQRYLSTLLRLGRDEQAFELFTRLREVEAGFQPEYPGQLLRLAETAYRRREPALALALVQGFDKRHPRHADIPGVYMLAARIMSEHYRKDDMAGAILRGLRQKYPDHPLAAEAEAYLRVLDNLRTGPA